MSDDLVTWLRAQLDEDERLAEVVPRYDWTIYLAGDVETGEHTEQRVLDHVIRHDPTRVLAEVQAKRALIEETIRPWLGNDQTTGRIAWAALRLLALPYADREGYREEWRP